jgi:hypothetical protein
VDEPRDKRLPQPEGGRLLKFPSTGAAPAAAATGASDANDAAERSAGELFGLLWHALADVLGTAAAAALLRRAAQRAAAAVPELFALEITRVPLEYQYKVPGSWHDAGPESLHALSALVAELWPLLVELTGSVVVGRLAQVPELRQRGVVPPRGSS